MIKTSRILECYQIELVDKLESLLDEFFRDMTNKGLKTSTAERHVANAELFLIEYHAFYLIDEITNLRIEMIYDFLGQWYFQKVHQPSKKDLQGIIVSLRRFFSFALKKGILPEESCLAIKAVLGDDQYFYNRFEIYKKDPDGFIYPENKSYLSCNVDSLDSDDQVKEVISDDMINSVSNEQENAITLEEMIAKLIQRFKAFKPQKNILSIIKKEIPKLAKDSSSYISASQEEPTIQSLKDHCMSLHRANHVFMRWLDRYNCQMSHLPTETVTVCIECDMVLTSLLMRFDVEMISTEEIKQGHNLFDMIDQMLWNARFKIAHTLGLDLRTLHL